MKFSFRLPEWIAERLFPELCDRAEAHGKASQNKRLMGGLIEIQAIVTAEPVPMWLNRSKRQ